MYILEQLRSRRSALSDIFAFAPFSNVNVVVDGQPEIDASAQYVSWNYYDGLGVPALIGRTLTRDGEQPASAPVAVISHAATGRVDDREYERPRARFLYRDAVAARARPRLH